MPSCIYEADNIGMAFEYPLVWLYNQTRQEDVFTLPRTIMSTSFFTSASIASLGTAIRLRT